MTTGNNTERVSIVVEATQAINQMIKYGTAVEQVGSVMGKTDAELRRVDRTLDKTTATLRSSASTMVRLRQEIKEMGKETTFLNNANARLDARLLTANKKLAEQKQIISTQGQVIRSLVKDNMGLAASYDKVGASASAANAKMAAPKIGKLGAPLQQTPQGYFPNGAVPLAAIAEASNKATKGIRGTAQAVDELGQNVQQNALRYQLYDVAATLGIVGAAAMASGLAVARAGIMWDKNFANVVRTSQVTGTAVEWLKNEFLDLQTTIPVTSEDLAKIGTLGAQMGVAAANLANFTAVTAQFSATSGLNVDESATALSRLDQLLPDVEGNYSKLASTILRTGVNAVATEAQIVRGTSQIASMGQIAGMTTPEVVALSSAMSSLGFSPELQRSVITSSFSRILTATSQVTEKTEKFGEVLGITGKQFQQAWREDAVGTYRNLLQAIASRGDAVTVLQGLGLASQRLTPNLLKLGQNTEVLDAALKDTTDEWGKNGELTRQYGVIANTVSARIQIMAQTWEALLVTLDDSDVVIKPLIDGLTNILKWLRDIAKIPGVSAFASITSAVVALTAVVALGAAGLAGLAAGYIAITNASAGLAALTAANTTTTIMNTAAQAGNNAVRTIGVGATTAQSGALAANSAAVAVNAAVHTRAGDALLGFSSNTISALPSILKWTGIIGLAAGALTTFVAMAATSKDWGYDLEKAFNGVDTPEKSFRYTGEQLKKIAEEAKEVAEVRAKIAAKERADREAQNAWNKAHPPVTDPRTGQVYANRFAKTEKPDPRVGAEQRRIASENASRTKALYKDIEDTILGIELPDDQFRALNDASAALGMTTGDLLKKLPGLRDLLGEGAVAAAAQVEEMDKLVAAQEIWAFSLDTSEENLAKLKSGITSGANSFLDFGTAMKDAYAVDEKSGARLGGGITEFISTMNTQISDFESFYGDIGKLVQKGGVQLAGFFAAQGPEAAQALADSLALGPDQIAQIERQMELAAFYSSEDFANTFAQNNAILAQVWKQSGNDPAAVAAFNEALAASMKNGSIDPQVLAGLAAQFGIQLDVNMIPGIDPDQFNNALSAAEATITPIKVPVHTIGPGGLPVEREMQQWIVEMEGHSITMTVDPNTLAGEEILAQWRANQYQIPIELTTKANTTTAQSMLHAFINKEISKTHYINFQVRVNPGGKVIIPGLGNIGTSAEGSMVHNQRLVKNNYPGFANGTILRGPGSGTSDSILARVSNGEAITRARAVRFYGTKMMEDINNMRFPRYANGGFPNGTPGGGQGPQQVINATVIQHYPTTQDPIKTLKQDAESVIAGIWT